MSTVLTIAGTDSIGGAGVAADLKAFASMDLHGCCVITAVTSQNTQRVSAIHPVPARVVETQLDAVFDDLQIDAVKTGMIYSAEIAEVVAQKLYKEKVPLVVDPVLCAGVGSSLFREDLKAAMFARLFPLATVVTPNRMEAEEFSSIKIMEASGSEDACRYISGSGAEAVLLKGGHFEGPMVTDLLLHDGKFTEFTSPRLPIQVHGSGCTLSSYIAGYIAQGRNIRQAIAASKRRVQDAIAMSSRLGKGMAIVNPMATKQKEGMRYPHAMSLRKAMEAVGERIPRSFVPENGMDFVYALPNPQDFSEVCGIENSSSGPIERCGPCLNISFGRSGWMSRAILNVNIEHPELLSGLELRYSEGNVQILVERGITEMIIEGDLENNPLTLTDATEDTSKQLALLSGSLLKWEGMGRAPRIGVVGRDPDEVLRILGPCLDG
jgi:hydroxymethylpyrimidine kinase / phosphomethylpyrimidine kinase / thiamine-phosphate diphosphorylase